MSEVDPMHPSTERRRSARVSDALPLVIRGNDLLGQPFEERTATLNFNLHGCRYSSKHHLPKNTWLTLELPRNAGRRNVRARVAWIQRPHSVREFFQIAVELESPENIWGLDTPPLDWAPGQPVYQSTAGSSLRGDFSAPIEASPSAVPTTIVSFMGKLMADMKDSSFKASDAEANSGPEFTPAADSPFLRELRAELDRHAVRAVETAAARTQEQIKQSAEKVEQRRVAASEESSRKWREQFEKAQSEARKQFDEHLSTRQGDFLKGFKAEVEENFGRARELMIEFDQKLQTLRDEAGVAQETIGRLSKSRLEAEAAEVARASQTPPEAAKENGAASENDVRTWRERLQSEMNLAQAQWNELLQSSLDSSLQRLVQQLSERSQEIQQTGEHRISERFADLMQPLSEAATKAGETLAEVRSALDRHVADAHSSLEDTERSAARIRENSAQFEAASHDSLNELHRRLENMLDAQTSEMTRRIEVLAAGMSQRISPAIESMGNQQVERATAQMETKLAPHLERVPALIRELAAREVQAEEGLRLHRERLRQASENIQRDVDSRMVFTLAELHRDFESARTQALAKWNEELDTSGVRASHAATESLSRASEWFQQEARSRLQVLVEQALTNAQGGFDVKAAEATEKFEARLAEKSTNHVTQISRELEEFGNDFAARTRTGLESAAIAAASSFGEVLRGISDQEIDFFGQKSRNASQEKLQEFERTSNQLLRNLDSDAQSSMERFHLQMGSLIENRIEEGRDAFATEFGKLMDAYRVDRDAHDKQWMAQLNDITTVAEGKYQERLENASDSWSVSSVRRLNEHGQNVIESLMRSADQSLRDSFAKVFEGLSALLRERAPGNAAGAVGFAPGSNREPGDSSSSHHEATKH